MKNRINRSFLPALLLFGFMASNMVLIPAGAQDSSSADTKPQSEAPATDATTQKPVQPAADPPAAKSPTTPGDSSAKSSAKPLLPLEQAKVHYQKNEYQKALTILDKLPTSDSKRYFSGLCYQGLGNQKKATEELAWLAYYAKDATLKNYALRALRNGRPGKPMPKERGRSTSTLETSKAAVRGAEENTRMLWGKMRAANHQQGAPWNTGVRSWSAQDYDHNQVIRGFDER